MILAPDQKLAGAMEFNHSNSSFDIDLFHAANSAANVCLFFLAVLPGLVLSLLCVLALFLAQSLNWPLKISLINILAGEIWRWVGLSVLFLGYPGRVGRPAGTRESCLVFFGAVISASCQKFLAITLYAILVYSFIKHGVKTLKMRLILLFIVLSWLAAVGLGVLPYIPGFGARNNDGFCASGSPTTSRVFLVGLVISMLILIVCTFVTTVFSTLVFRYVWKNTIDENANVKKAIVKNLVYLLISIALTSISHVVPSSFTSIRMVLVDDLVLQVVVVEYILRVSLNFGSIATPIVAIVVLKPVRLALKKILKKICVCYKRSPEPEETEMEQSTSTKA